jgi:glutamate 5-kinase
MERVVLKIGTAVLNEAGEGAGASQNTSPQLKIEHIVGNIVPHLDDNSQQLVIVSSGAVGLGSQRLAFGQSRSLTETQICASVGQAQLIENYTKALARHGYSAAQILLTSSDLQNASRRKNVISCLQQMANQKVIPIVNENDVLSTEEIEPLRGERPIGLETTTSCLAFWRLKSKLQLWSSSPQAQGSTSLGQRATRTNPFH